MKKFMSVLLAFAMVFACLPIQGGAAEEDTQYTEATIDFSDVANRTGYSTTQQVWEQNGITVTNNKGSSTTNIGDFYNPVRFYKNSQLIVACNGMIQIVFAANTTSYASDLNSAITAAGFTSSVSGKIVTVAFDEPVDSFEVTLSTAKVFMDSITVTVPATSEPRATVSFDLNYDGATGAPGNATIIVGSTYGTLPQVSREGYTFDGWFKDAAYTGTAVEATDTVTEDHVLYAKWTAKPVATVSFDLNGEDTTDAPEAVTVIVGSTYEALPTASREGYIFGGWFTDIGCIGTAVKATDVVNESHTLYAKWTEAVEGEISEITIDFSTTDQRTGYSTEQQAWTNGALTFTNDKDTSTTDVGDYSNPVRLYKNSSVTIACAGMTQIVIVSNGTSDYKANLTGSLDAAGVTYTTSDDTYTILLAEPADTFTVSLSAGQARFKSITVIASTSGGEAPNPTPEETEPTSIEHFTYTTDGTNLTITGYTGTDTEVVISGTYTIDGVEYTVTNIGESAFENCTGLTSVTIPDSVTSIDYRAFYECSSLTSVTIPDSVTNIGNDAFAECKSLTSVTIPNNVESIGNNAFSGCGLTSVIIPDSVESIGIGAFLGCSSLTSVTIGDGVTSIVDWMFEYCISLTSVTIGEGITSIGSGAFTNCGALETVYYGGSEEQKGQIAIGNYNDSLISATWVYNYNSQEESNSAIVENWGLTLKDEIVVKFNMTFTEEILADEAAYVEVKVGSTTMNVPVAQVTGPIQVPVMASQMTEKITLCIVDGNGVSSETDSFTVRQYCDTVLGNEEYAEYHQLVKEMLNYGSAAQLYFDKNTGDLAGQGIDDVGLEAVPTTGGEYTLEDQIEGLDCYGATLVLRDKIGLRYYFTGDLTGCTFAVNSVATELEIGDGNYVEVADILPQNLDEDITLTVTDANGNTINVKYCPMNYIIRMNQKGESKTKELVKALYNYHLAAKDFSGS